MLLGDVEGHSELRFTRRSSTGDHSAGHGGCHLHLHLVLIGPSYVFEKSVEASAHGSVPVCPTQRGAHPVGGMVCADLIVLALILCSCELGILQPR